MERPQFRRRGGIALLLSVAALGAAGCGPNYSGEGNEFDVLGKVTEAGSKSLKAEIYQIKEANGEAQGWFDDHGEHQLHDNCECDGDFFIGNETAGHVENMLGYEVEPAEVAVGSCVEFIGKIRASHYGKSYEDRPVYELARIINC